jgi:integrase
VKVAAKVRWDREAWWVFTHYQGRRKKKRIGPTKADKRRAQEIARKIDAALALGTFVPDRKRERLLPANVELRRWHADYGPTFKPSYEAETIRIIENDLVSFFGSKDLRELREPDLLDFVRAKLDAGRTPKTISNSLSVLRRVLNLLERDGLLSRNPAARLGELMRRVDRRTATEVRVVDSWTPQEVETLLTVAREHEPRFHPALTTLFYTGLRRGELLGLQWEDVDLERRTIHVCRAYVKRRMTTPKGGRGRFVAIAPSLGELLIDVLAIRRRKALAHGGPETPEWVFPSSTGTPIDPDNFDRTWRRVRRRAQKLGVRPLRLHCARHTWASLALESGKSVRWVADQLGHADPALTLQVYAHVIPNEEPDLSFLDFGGPGRPYTAPPRDSGRDDAGTSAVSGRDA